MVAVKVLADVGDPQFVTRFQREARLIAQLQHRNIVPIYDHGDEDGHVYLALQYVEGGRTLADLAGWPMRAADAVGLLVHLLAGLGYAHASGFVHRDVKPSNVLLPEPDWPLLADFGIAKLLLEGSARLTATGQVVGTAAYMAPEQALGLAVDARTDLYAAGVVLYELLTGRVPFEADTPSAVLLQHAYKSPPPPRELNPGLPSELEAVVLRALAKEPADRYQRAEEMAGALQALQADLVALPPAAPPIGPIAPPAKARSVEEELATLLEAAGAAQAPTKASAPPAVDSDSLATTASSVRHLPPDSQAPPARPPLTRQAHLWHRPVGIGRNLEAAVFLGFLAVVALLAFLAWMRQQGAPTAAEGEVVLEPAPTLGPDPFAPNFAAPPVPVTPTTRPAPSGSGRTLQGERGSTPGLYGGTRNNASCDREQMIAFFQAHPDKATAWVEALNSDPTLRWSGGTKVEVHQIPAYLQELTPVALRSDTRVTNNGFLDGRPTPRQSVLQAGTAVLVDRYGIPRARCACGNPLLALHPTAATPRYAGQRWPGFDPAKLVAIQPSPTVIDTFTLTDLHTGQLFQRPAGTTGANDGDPQAQTTPPPAAPPRPNPTETITEKVTVTPTLKPPAAPSNLRAVAVDQTTIRLNWADNSSNEEGFKIFNGDGQNIPGPNVTTWTWTSDLAPGTSMCYQVRSFNSAGDSEPTAQVCATTPGPPAVPVPTAPSDLRVSAVDSSAIRVEWSDNSDNEDGFGISNGENEVTVGQNVTTYTWGDLAPESYMCLKVRSFNSAGDSGFIPSTSPYYVCTTTPPETITDEFVVPADRDLPGVDTGIDLAAGDQVTISARGTASYGFDSFGGCDGYPMSTPDGDLSLNGSSCGRKIDDNALADAPVGKLLASIGEPEAQSGAVWLAGSSFSATADRAGRLFLIYNDVPGHYLGNSGTYEVTVTVTR